MTIEQTKAAKRVNDAYRKASENPYFSSFASSASRNEQYYLGHQWANGEAPGLTKPVFNVIGRICDYRISTLCQKSYSINYSLEGAPPKIAGDYTMKFVIRALDKHIKFLYDKESLERLIFSAVHDAAIYGSGLLYTYWDAGADTGQRYMGRFNTIPLDPTCLYPADPKDPDIDSQEYLIIRSRVLASKLKEEALAYGISEETAKKIIPDEEDDGKCECFTFLEKRGGYVHFIKAVEGVLISEGDTTLTRYPIAMYSPIPKRGSFFGEPLVSSMIPNQDYINRSYCMLMKHMQDSAFSKVIYDKSRIPEWVGEPGSVIAAHGGGNLSDSVAIVGTGELSDGYRELSDRVMVATKELYGATEVALGNVEPNNTSAILAARDAAAGQLKGSLICLTTMLEAQARIWADMIVSYYGMGRLIQLGHKEWVGGIDFKKIATPLLNCRITVGDLDKFGSSVSLLTLDKLLDCGAITPEQYIERLPDGILPMREELLPVTEEPKKEEEDEEEE